MITPHSPQSETPEITEAELDALDEMSDTAVVKGKALRVLTSTIRQLRQERDELRAVVEKLPKTEDGKTVVPEMALFIHAWGRVHEAHASASLIEFAYEGSAFRYPVHCCSSTRAAAALAAEVRT